MSVPDQIFNIIDDLPQQYGGPTVQWHYAGTSRTYGVQVIWQSPEVETSIEYDINMVCAGLKDDEAVWRISKDNYYTDNIKPEDTVEMLAIACAAPCYPFEFTATKNGQIVSLLNVDRLKNRFTDAKSTLLRDFEGDIVLAYIAEMEAAINQTQQLKKLVTADVWISLFFAAILGTYNPQKTKPITLHLPCFGFEDPLSFKGIVSIGDPDFVNTAQALQIEAELDPSVSTQNQTIIGGKLEAAYDIDIPGHQIRNISTHISLTTIGGEKHIWLKGFLTATDKI
jgi:hypothetical protein